MSDTYTAWSTSLARGDWVQLGPVLQSGSDIVTAVLISLFTDRVANADDVIPDGSNDPRGWWADAGKYPIGSRLWLLDRSKQTDEVLKRAKDYANEALKWLVDDGVAAKVTVFVEWSRPGMLGMQVVVYRQDGTMVPMNFAAAWNLAAITN